MGSYLNPGNLSFRGSLRSKIYVDKSELICRTNEVLFTEQKYICVSRPRRFGKSMAANMLSAYYGATVNMDAVSILMSFMIMFFANACGINVSISMMIIILLANVLLSVGTPGIPGGAIASFAALATMAGLPAGVMGVYISINTLCDMGATCVNVIGDMAGCVVLKEKIKLED